MSTVHCKNSEKIMNFYSKVDSVFRFLEWDFFINLSGRSSRSKVDALLAEQSVLHSIISSDNLCKSLDRSLSEHSGLSSWKLENLKLASAMCRLSREIPLPLLEVINRSRLECLECWNLARRENNYSLVVKPFKTLVSSTREYLSIKKEIFDAQSLYDAAVFSFDQELKTSFVDSTFHNVGKFLSENGDYLCAKKVRTQKFPRNVFVEHKQKKLLDFVSSAVYRGELGFLGIDVCEHEFFCCFHDVVRMGVQCSPANFVRGLRSFLRGVGYSLPYIPGSVPRHWVNQPISAVGNNTLREIISSLFCIHVFSSEEFAKFILPAVKDLFSGKNREWSVENVLSITRASNPSLIMSDCDEMSLMAHLMMRYSIEGALIKGDLSVEDLPDAWNEGANHYFKVAPKNVSEGCLQDYHWFNGMFGYFPSLAIAIINSNSLFNTINLKNNDVLLEIESGNFAPLVGWISENILCSDIKSSAHSVVKKISGGSAKASAYINSLRSKYIG